MAALAKKILASKEHPILLCLTCGLATGKIQLRRSNTLRKERRKSWNRTIKYSPERRTTYHNRIVKAKEIFFSYLMIDCLKKRHRISVRKAPFSSKMVIKLK